jgi:hypothetical protein
LSPLDVAAAELLLLAQTGVTRLTHHEERVGGVSLLCRSPRFVEHVSGALELLDAACLTLLRRVRLAELMVPEVHLVGPFVALSAAEWDGDQRRWAIGLVFLAAQARESKRALGWAIRAARSVELPEAAEFIAQLNRGELSALAAQVVH